ncbi:16S rRNA (cytidine(1402)-2'-O)-methyltransferase [Thalassorhabdus alkalitolerans]|uniref:Ribosomal RNA small subunit methyltransferase I n=1 Tax=Thalassorhabdus alkalitolerans TaxID=2282697 RepID=A0ABW0YST8_9BACI
MNQQKSYHTAEADKGHLYLVPTPIGNLEDMTFRAVRILQEADVILAEDTRQTRKLCTHFEIPGPLDSYHEHNKEQKEEKVLGYLKEGKTVALVSDAGTPLVSDPGQELVSSCVRAGFSVIPLPGANAAVTALIASGLAGGPFYFYGFLPRKNKEKAEILDKLSYVDGPVIFYESPYRIGKTVEDIEKQWGDREAALARELTKRHEEIFRGTLTTIREALEKEPVKGECCLIVQGTGKAPVEEQAWWQALDPAEHVKSYIKEGMSSKEAIKQAAKDREVPKREVYSAFHELD